MELSVQLVAKVGGGYCQVIQFPQQSVGSNPVSWWLNHWSKVFAFYGL